MDHFHNGPVNALFLAAVLHIVVAVRHASGKGVQFAGVLAKLPQRVAGKPEDNQNSEEHPHGGEQQDYHIGLAIVLLHLRNAELRQFRSELLNLSESRAGGFQLLRLAADETQIGVCMRIVPLHLAGESLHARAFGRSLKTVLQFRGRGLHGFQIFQRIVKFFLRGTRGQVIDGGPRPVGLVAQGHKLQQKVLPVRFIPLHVCCGAEPVAQGVKTSQQIFKPPFGFVMSAVVLAQYRKHSHDNAFKTLQFPDAVLQTLSELGGNCYGNGLFKFDDG